MTATDAAAHRVNQVVDLDDERAGKLRRANLLIGLLHLAQGVVLLVLSTDFAIAITASYAEGPPGTAIGDVRTVFELLVGPAVAAFLLLAAADHLLVGGPLNGRYTKAIRRGSNPFRWLEYSVSATLMIGLIALLTGLTTMTALIAIVGANVAMIAAGHLMEKNNPPEREHTRWGAFRLGCLAGIFPWLAIAFQLAGSEATATDGEGVPTFVYGIFVSLFVLFFSFGVMQFLQFRGKGKFKDYVRGEYGYLVLSLVAKSVLAWQVFANVLIG